MRKNHDAIYRRLLNDSYTSLIVKMKNWFPLLSGYSGEMRFFRSTTERKMMSHEWEHQSMRQIDAVNIPETLFASSENVKVFGWICNNSTRLCSLLNELIHIFVDTSCSHTHTISQQKNLVANMILLFISYHFIYWNWNLVLKIVLY